MDILEGICYSTIGLAFGLGLVMFIYDIRSWWRNRHEKNKK